MSTVTPITGVDVAALMAEINADERKANAEFAKAKLTAAVREVAQAQRVHAAAQAKLDDLIAQIKDGTLSR